MKKILWFGIILSTLCCFAFTGCKDYDDIEYTAPQPIFLYETVMLENYEELLQAGEMYWTVTGCEPLKNFKSYKDFSQYYAGNLKGSNAYLLYRDNEVFPLTPYEEGSFSFYREKVSGKIILNESYKYYDSGLGSKPYEDKVPYDPVSLYIDIFIIAIDNVNLNELNFEFGKLENGFFDLHYYVNIYTGDECFATCFYDSYVKISREWFETYFKTHLISGDNL